MTERHTRGMVLGLEVRDQALYSRYREGMMPILARYGGRFGYDFTVAEVLKSEQGERINRVFTIVFEDAGGRARFFSDPEYQRVRTELFEPSVVSTTILAEFEP